MYRRAAVVAMLLASVRAEGQVTKPAAGRAWLGFSVDSVSGRVLVIREVASRSPAARAGVKPGDTIAVIGGQPALWDVLTRLSDRIGPGDTILLGIRASTQSRTAVLVAGAIPATRVTVSGGHVSRLELDSGGRILRSYFDTAAPVSYAVQVGGRSVAGAELSEVESRLGRYFGVESGLLVLHVAAGTPAADAGLLSGDVIAEANGSAVHRIVELRASLAANPRPRLLVWRDRKQVRIEFRE